MIKLILNHTQDHWLMTVKGTDEELYYNTNKHILPSTIKILGCKGGYKVAKIKSLTPSHKVRKL